MLAAKNVQRQMAVFVTAAVEKPPFLFAVQWLAG
jgi:hypothetical protein